MNWSEGDVAAADGAKLHFYRQGSGSPVVLAHGATDNGLCWGRLADGLAERYDVVAFDARYHGKSDAPEGAAPSGELDLLALVEQLGLDHPALVGHSMGGRTVAQAAASHPGLFRCAVLEDPPWWNEPPDVTRGRGMDWSGMSIEEIAALGREQSPTWDESEFAPWAESKKQFRPSQEWLNGVRGMGAGFRETAAAIGVPTLLVCGDPALGAIVTPAVAKEVQALNPRIEVASFPAGHNVRREAFEGVRDAVTAFLARHN